MKRFKLKTTYIPVLGYLDAATELAGERILHTLTYQTETIQLQNLAKGDTVVHVDVVWCPSNRLLYGRYRTNQGVLVCIPYALIDDILEPLD